MSLNLTVVPRVQGTYSLSPGATEMLSGETCGRVVRWETQVSNLGSL